MANPMLYAYQDTELLQETIRLLDKHNVRSIYETGTWYGMSTYILAFTLPATKIFSYELNPRNVQLARNKNKDMQNVLIREVSSPEGLMNDLVEGISNVILFLDAHWNKYWPILDELKVIAQKKIKPVIIIHDFYVPDDRGSPLFHFDSYDGKYLNLEYIKPSLEIIYGVDGYTYYYSKTSKLNSGVIYIEAK